MILTFAKAISGPDRVTITISNAEIITYTRRLDVLPGDVNDDDAVNSTDGVLILRDFTPANPYNMFYDMNGDGAVNMTDFDIYRPQIGTVLPGGEPQLAVGGVGPGGVASLTPDELAPVLATAIDEWASAGLPVQDVAKLHTVTAQITDLPAGLSRQYGDRRHHDHYLRRRRRLWVVHRYDIRKIHGARQTGSADGDGERSGLDIGRA